LESRQLLSGGSVGGAIANVTYHGGPLLQNVQIQSVFYGQAWSTNSSLQQQIQQTDTFLQYFVTSPYVDVLKQYNVSGGTFIGSDVVAQNPSGGQTIDDSQIQSILNSEITSGKVSAPNANSLYVFFVEPGVLVTANGQNSTTDFAGYHDVFTDKAGAAVYYAVVPYPTGNVVNVPLTVFQQETVVLSHEVSEAMTDPDTQTGWFDRRLGEIADIAEGNVGVLGGYEVQYVWSQAAGQIVLPSASTTTSSSVAVTGTEIQASAGEPFTSVVATITGADSSATTSSFTATINWGNGNTTTGTITADPNGGFDVTGTNTYAQAGKYQITVTVDDPTGALVGTATSKAVVSAAPSPLTAKGTIITTTSGQSFTGTVATFTDTNTSATTANFTAIINWGDGTTTTGTVTVDPNGGFDVTGTHTYTAASQQGSSSPWGDPDSQGQFNFFDGRQVYLITVMISDNVSNTAATALSLAKVAPVPPVIEATGQNVAAVSGQSLTATVATFTDSNTSAVAGDFTATIHWGDGSTSTGTVTADPNGGFDVTGTHTYTSTSDWPGWGGDLGFHHGFGNGHFVIAVDIVDTKTQDEATADSLATVSPTALNLTVTAQNITATSGTQFSGVVATFTSTDTTATASTFTATIDWGDGTSSLGTITVNSSGVFGVIGTHTYALTGRGGFDLGQGNPIFGSPGNQFLFSVTVQDNTTNDTATALGLTSVTAASSSGSTPGSTPTTPDQLFVIQLYQQMLGRLPDIGGLAYWTNLLNQGTSRSTIVTQIEQSQEYSALQVESLYQSMLHRNADPTGLTAFTNLLTSGGSLDQVRALIAGSQEFFQTQGSGQTTGFLDALYADALQRSVDPTGLAVFGQDLAQGVSRQAIAAAVFGSQEYQHDLIEGDYQTYLARQADTSGMSTFLAAMQQGTNDQGVVAAIVGSQEYYQKL